MVKLLSITLVLLFYLQGHAMVIHKFPFVRNPNSTYEYYITVPADAKVLSVQLQHRKFTAWASLEDTREEHPLMTIKRFEVIGTGWEVPSVVPRTYITTIQDRGYVWHVFSLD